MLWAAQTITHIFRNIKVRSPDATRPGLKVGAIEFFKKVNHYKPHIATALTLCIWTLILLLFYSVNLKGGYPIIFASNVFHNSHLIQKCLKISNSCWFCIYFWIKWELWKTFDSKMIGWSHFRPHNKNTYSLWLYSHWENGVNKGSMVFQFNNEFDFEFNLPIINTWQYSWLYG